MKRLRKKAKSDPLARAEAGTQTLAEAFCRHESEHGGRGLTGSTVTTAVVLLRFSCGCLVMSARGVNADVESVTRMLETYAAGLRQDPEYMLAPGEMYMPEKGEPS